MRRLRYEVLVRDRSVTAEGNLSEFLQRVPYLFMDGVIPSRDVLNDFLRQGIADYGMSGGCQWEPFQVSTEELVRELGRAKGYRFVEPPEWVETQLDWSIWRMGCSLRIPPEEQVALKELHDEEREWGRKS